MSERPLKRFFEIYFSLFRNIIGNYFNIQLHFRKLVSIFTVYLLHKCTLHIFSNTIIKENNSIVKIYTLTSKVMIIDTLLIFS